ncbi:MAG: S41 family peptidase [Anaerolineales bacterium]|nr:S41 family peptidase [Anaerolineales bacterium]
MKRIPFVFVLLTTALALLVSACGTPARPAEPETTATQPPAAPPTATVAPSATPKPTKEPPKTGPLATAAALSAQVTLVPPTPVGGFDTSDLAADDYVGITKQAWHIIQANYVRDNFNGADWDAVYDEYVARAETVTSSEELWDLLADMVHELNDDHSRFVPPENMQGEFGVGGSGGEGRPWTGISVWPGPSREDEYFYAWDVCEYGAAADAGLVRGDVILAVDGEPLVPGEDGFTREQTRAVTFGTGGPTVTLTVQSGPDEDPRDVTLTLGGGGGCMDWAHEIVSESPYIGYIRVPDFDGDAASNIMAAIEDMEADQPLDGLIVDVRHNPGGNSDESSGIFADGKVGTEGPLREGKQRTSYYIRGVDWNDTTPMVVLTDGSSHSAADYFPAAMKELGRATIIGMNSAGNTEGIISFGLADGTLIRLAVMTMALNDGTLLEGIGVTPDIEVPLGMWGLRQQPYDVQLQAAIDYLSK